MTLDATFNGNYGGSNVTSKYTPLNISEHHSQAAYYDGIINTRMTEIEAYTNGGSLVLITDNWATRAQAEVNNHPPIIVVSSNRSQWISQAHTPILADPAGPHDWRYLDSASATPPFYELTRLGDAERNVYIVVHAHEYQAYSSLLTTTHGAAHSNMIVVGYHFQNQQQFAATRQADATAVAAGQTAPVPMPARQAATLSGFGASRFAAIEVCKLLRRGGTVRGAVVNGMWSWAWMMDDNVVQIDNFPGLIPMEDDANGTMVGNTPLMALGMHGGTRAEAPSAQRTTARGMINANRPNTGPRGSNANVNRTVTPLPVPNNPDTTGLLQQVTLWNVAEFERRGLNFANFFINSAEDASLGNLMDVEGIPYRWYSDMGVIKESVGAHDDQDSVKAVKNPPIRTKQAKLRLSNDIRRAESSPPAIQQNGLPPPVAINVPGTGPTRIVPLVDGNLSDRSDVQKVVASTQCTEQITKEAIKQPGRQRLRSLMGDTARDRVFQYPASLNIDARDG